MKPRSIVVFASTLALSAAMSAGAATLVTYMENPDALNSSLSGTQVFDFNDLAVGLNTDVNWSGVGSFDRLYVKSPDRYGGATDAANPNGSRYSVQGAGTSVSTATLSLDSPSAYFGMWWSAGDPSNILSFYYQNELVAQYTTASLLSVLPDSYDGNPKNRSLNPNEPYAFVNFYGDETTLWDEIQFSNVSRSGFESDNYTTRVEAWDPLVDGELSGVPVALLEGATQTVVNETDIAGTTWAEAPPPGLDLVPGAPAPPITLLALFGAVALARGMTSKRTRIDACSPCR